ncbi:N/A [soil metagenome]
MIFRNKRAAIARGMIGSGLLGLLERWARRPSLVVVCYHRIGNPALDPFYRPVFSATPEHFRAQVQYLRDRFRLLRLDEVIPLVESGLDLKEPTALITFDDGYQDNFEVALPILNELKAAATFFLPADFLRSPRLFWWDRVAYVIHQTPLKSVTLDLPQPLHFDFSTSDRDAVIFEIVHAFLQEDLAGEKTFLAHLEERAEVDVLEKSLGGNLFMGFEAARILLKSGMDIGSHSLTHPKLARLPEDVQYRELVDSKSLLEQELGCPIEAIAYPFGGLDAFTNQTKRLARSAGYRLGFAFLGGTNRTGHVDAMALKRINVGFADSPELLRARLTLCASAGSSFV